MLFCNRAVTCNLCRLRQCGPLSVANCAQAGPLCIFCTWMYLLSWKGSWQSHLLACRDITARHWWDMHETTATLIIWVGRILQGQCRHCWDIHETTLIIKERNTAVTKKIDTIETYETSLIIWLGEQYCRNNTDNHCRAMHDNTCMIRLGEQ